MKLPGNEDMFHGASPDIFKKAKELRNRMTLAEKVLWSALSQNQMMGLKFRRQHPIGNFIADFYCHKAKFVIEIDGGIHFKSEQKEYDKGRTYELNQLGIFELRFTNDQVLNEIESVLQTIRETLKIRLDLKDGNV